MLKINKVCNCKTWNLKKITNLLVFFDIFFNFISVGTSDKLYINAKRVGGAWQWKSDGSKTIFSDDDLDDSTIGDYVVIDGSTGRLTSSDNSDHKTICMKGIIQFVL